MLIEDWIRDVYLTLRDFSSVEMQYQRWVTGKPVGSYWGEDVAQLLNDYSFASFLRDEWDDTGLSRNLKSILQDINDLLISMLGNEYDFKSLQEDSNWQSVIKKSKVAVSLMEVEASEALKGFIANGSAPRGSDPKGGTSV